MLSRQAWRTSGGQQPIHLGTVVHVGVDLLALGHVDQSGHIARDVPALPLWYQANIVIAQKNVGNITVDASGDWGFIKNVTVEK